MISKKIMDIFRGVCISYGLTIFLLGILAFIVYQFEVGENIVSIGIVITYISTTFLGGIYVGKKTKERKFLWGLLLGVLYFLLLMIISYAFHQGEIVAMSYHMMTTWFLCMGGGMLGGMFG